MKKVVVLVVYCLIVSVTWAQNNQAIIDYIDQYKHVAMEEMQRTGVPAAITLAQGINESKAGQSTLAVETNNHFGIKCKAEWTGDIFYYDDDAKDECFRSYPCVDDSYRDHSDFLANRPNYTFLFSLDPLNYKAWSYGLKKAGYATSSTYALKLIKTIEDYNLQKYSEIALNKETLEKEEETVLAGEEDKQKDQVKINDGKTIPVENSYNDEKIIIPESQDDTVTNVDSKYPFGIFTINNTKVIYADAGTSLFAIAANNHIEFKKLLEFNELPKEEILIKGTLIYLEKKQKESDKIYHIVSQNESLKDIAQEEGIQLQSLLAYNNLSAFVNPSTGERILLQQPENKKQIK